MCTTTEARAAATRICDLRVVVDERGLALVARIETVSRSARASRGLTTKRIVTCWCGPSRPSVQTSGARRVHTPAVSGTELLVATGRRRQTETRRTGRSARPVTRTPVAGVSERFAAVIV